MSGTLTSFTPVAAAGAAAAERLPLSLVLPPLLPYFEDHNQRAGRHFVSPVFTSISFTVPANGAGTSSRPCRFDGDQRLFSFNGCRPAFTITSVTSTSSLPISERVNVFRCRSRCCCRSRFFLLFCSSRCSVGCTVGRIENHDKCTGLRFCRRQGLLISFTTPACGTGTSIELCRLLR